MTVIWAKLCHRCPNYIPNLTNNAKSCLPSIINYFYLSCKCVFNKLFPRVCVFQCKALNVNLFFFSQNHFIKVFTGSLCSHLAKPVSCSVARIPEQKSLTSTVNSPSVSWNTVTQPKKNQEVKMWYRRHKLNSTTVRTFCVYVTPFNMALRSPLFQKKKKNLLNTTVFESHTGNCSSDCI